MPVQLPPILCLLMQRTVIEVNDGSAIEIAETNGGEIVRVQYYTMQGIEVTSPSVSGLYIVKKTYDTKKVVVEKNFISVK